MTAVIRKWLFIGRHLLVVRRVLFQRYHAHDTYELIQREDGAVKTFILPFISLNLVCDACYFSYLIISSSVCLMLRIRSSTSSSLSIDFQYRWNIARASGLHL